MRTNSANHRLQIALLVCLAMLAFAGNSLLCRMALKQTAMDPASFTSVRLLSGACTLWLLVRLRHGSVTVNAELGTVQWPNGADLDPDVMYASISGSSVKVAT